jgi:hypothetical protein
MYLHIRAAPRIYLHEIAPYINTLYDYIFRSQIQEYKSIIKEFLFGSKVLSIWVTLPTCKSKTEHLSYREGKYRTIHNYYQIYLSIIEHQVWVELPLKQSLGVEATS